MHPCQEHKTILNKLGDGRTQFWYQSVQTLQSYQCDHNTVYGSFCDSLVTLAYTYFIICDWLWENPPVMYKDNYLEKRN